MESAGYVPEPEATQEFNVQTNSLPAEYGRSGGAVVNIVHRSGTREFHGKVYEYLRNEKLNANLFFDNRNGKDRRRAETTLALSSAARPRPEFDFLLPKLATDPGGSRIDRDAPHRSTVRMKNGDFGEVPARV